MPALFNRECKSGWGYNSSSDQLIVAKGHPFDCELNVVNSSKFELPSVITCRDPPRFNLAKLIDFRCRKYLDFCILFDDHEYWVVNWHATRKCETKNPFSQYPLNCNYYIFKVDYGVDLRIIFRKQGLPNDLTEIQELLNSKSLSDAQKRISCKVLINFDEVQEMTLEEMIQYTKHVRNDKNPPYDIPIYFGCRPLNNTVSKQTSTSNSENFKHFLHLLYYVFRKIEKIFEKTGSLQILDILYPKTELSSFQELKNAYKSVDKSDFLEMYPVVKHLFYHYLQYIKNSHNINATITEEDDLLEVIDELKKCLQDLNNWNPIPAVVCPGYEYVVQQLYRTKKFKNRPVAKSCKINRPFIIVNNENSFFGFIKMKEATATEIPEDAHLLETECPKDCTSESQKWICTECGDFISNKNLLLYCSCGFRKIRDKLFICTHESHRTWDIEKAPVLITPGGYDHVLQKLRQLRKYATIHVIENVEAHEPFIGEPSGEEHLFGFIDMTEADPGEIPKHLSFFEMECPQECTKDLRKWICTTCGDFVSRNDLFLYCSCGSKKYREKFFSCHHPSCQNEFKKKTNLLHNQLCKISIKQANHDPKISEAINILLTSTNKDAIIRTIRELEGPFDGDTQHIIDQIVNHSHS